MILKLGKCNIFRYTASGLFKRFGVRAAGAVVRSELLHAKNVRESKSSNPTLLHRGVIAKRHRSSEGSLDKLKFESICAETLDSLTEYFEELIETTPQFKHADVTYSDGVLTVNLGKSYGTYVINRQSPNLQIWLSSPTSGPKRYDFVDGTWVYKHDSTTLHSLLDKEIEGLVKKEVEFTKRCVYSRSNNS